MRPPRGNHETLPQPHLVRHYSGLAHSACGGQFYGPLVRKGSQAPATPTLRSAAVRAGANQSRVTAQRAVEDYVLPAYLIRVALRPEAIYQDTQNHQ